jgi:glycosyltransferase involved in cell wall biosynthesis
MTGVPRPLEGLVIAHVGHHDPEYSRNRLMAKALTRAGGLVVDLSDPRRYPARTARFVRALRKDPPDLVLVGFPGHSDVLAARLATLPRRVPVVLDALVSLYETAVEDRARVSVDSLAARRYILEDRAACALADLVLLDTEAHIAYFREQVGARSARFAQVWVGSDDEIMRPQPRSESERLRVLFYGTYIPLHGAEHIVRAAAELERTGDPVDLVMIGDGQTHGEVRRLAARLGVRSVRFTDRRLAYDDLPALIGGNDVCLGVFGTTAKAARVIPNKVFDGLAMARTIVTADTPAAREALTDGVDCRLCPPGDPAALAEILRELHQSRETTSVLASKGHELFRAEFSLDALSRRIAPVIRELVDA